MTITTNACAIRFARFITGAKTGGAVISLTEQDAESRAMQILAERPLECSSLAGAFHDHASHEPILIEI